MEQFGGNLREKIQTRAPKVPTGASPPFWTHLLGHLFGDFWYMFCVFDAKKGVLGTRPSFIVSLGRIGHSMRWAHVQSVHACAVQTHFSVFAFFLEGAAQKMVKWFRFGFMFEHKCALGAKKGTFKSDVKKVTLPREMSPYPRLAGLAGPPLACALSKQQTMALARSQRLLQEVKEKGS